MASDIEIPSIFHKCDEIDRFKFLLEQEIYLREISVKSHTEIELNGQILDSYTSCDYLELSSHPKIKQAINDAINSYGANISSSRILGGTLKLHRILEEKIAKFVDMEACIVFNMGYLTNIGSISSLVTKKEFVIVDSKCHASIIDACFLAAGQGAKFIPFKHNNLEDLEKKLAKYGLQSNKLIVVDGVYSMDGDFAKLEGIHGLARKYNAGIMVDDAHGIGVLGKNGKGIIEHFGMQGKIDLVMGTFSKAFGNYGGFIAGKKKIIDYLKYTSRPFIFSASLPPSTIAGILAALEIIGNEPHLRQNLWGNVSHFRERMLNLGFDLKNSESQIIPIHVGNDLKTCQLAKSIEKMGSFVDAIVYPAVKKKESMIRVILKTSHTKDQLDKMIKAFEKSGKELCLIK